MIKIDKKLKLVVIQVGNNEASNIYVRNKGKLCEEVGIDFCHQKYDDIEWPQKGKQYKC